MVIPTALCTIFAIITVSSLREIPTDLVTCVEDGVQLSSLCGNLPRRATGTSTLSWPSHRNMGRIPSYTPFYIRLLQDEIVQRKGDNAQEKACPEEGIDGAEDLVIDCIVSDDGPQTVTVTVAAAGTVCINVRVEAAGGNDDMM